MMPPDKPAVPSSRPRWSRARLAKVGAAYLVLAGLGIGVLLEFVPSLFHFGELTPLRLLFLLVLLIFVGAPVVAIGYIALSLLIEALVWGAGRVLETCFRALVRLFKGIRNGPRE